MNQKIFNIKRSLLLFLLFFILLINCNSKTKTLYKYKQPDKINDGFETGTLGEVNMDVALIEKAVNNIYSGKYKEVHSMLIYKDNKLVLEEYFQGHKYKWDAPNHHSELVTWDREMVHEVMSVTKSITSICIGIAVDKGYIKNVNQSIFDYLPDHQHLKKEGKEKITIEHLLTMTSGLEWKEWSAPYSSSDNPVIGLWFSKKDPISYILEKPIINEPGTKFNYSGGDIIILGEIIKNSSNMNIDIFSRKFLFEPLGINYSYWARIKNGVIESAGTLKIKPRDMTKISAVLLNKGVWNGKQIISESWIEKSAYPFPCNKKINVPGEDSGLMGYSYTWWTQTYNVLGKKINMYTASGFGGQHIMIFPELNMTVVFTCGNYLSFRPPYKILKKYILPAVIVN